MDKGKDFDDIIRSTLHKNTISIKASRNIFDEAWVRKDEKLIENNYSTIRSIARVGIVAACLITLVFTTVVIDTSKARSIAMEIYESLRTIFVVEKVGDEYLAVEKSEDIVYEFENLGSITIDDNKRASFEEILGFKLHFPDMIGEYYNRSFYPSAGITIYNVKLRDIEQYRDKFLQAIGNEKIYSALSDFDMQRSVSTQYTDKNGEGFYFYIKKHIPKYFPSTAKVIKKFDIGGVGFELIEVTRAMYPWKLEGGWRFEDMTQEPEKIIKLYYLVWDHDGVRYSIVPSGIPGEKVLDEEKAIEFAKAYMESLKAVSN